MNGNSADSSVDVVIKTAPQRIFLQISDDPSERNKPFSDSPHAGEVTWCQEPVLACEVPYVRADLVGKSESKEQKRELGQPIKLTSQDGTFKASEVMKLASECKCHAESMSTEQVKQAGEALEQMHAMVVMLNNALSSGMQTAKFERHVQRPWHIEAEDAGKRVKAYLT